MYGIGDTVIYGRNGVCRIEGRGSLPFSESREEYYVLRPISSESTVYVPVTSELLVSRMHPLLDSAALSALLASNEPREAEWIENENQRRLLFREVLEGGDRVAILRLCRTLRARHMALLARGRHLRQSDEKTLRDAERILCDEICTVLGVSRSEAEAMLGEGVAPALSV